MKYLYGLVVFSLGYFIPERMPFRQFRWYRQLLGGRWARVSRLFHGRKWVQVHPECVDRVEESWGSIKNRRFLD